MSGNVQWECFCDAAYWDMWAVRPVGDRDFSSPQLFHVANEVRAMQLVALLNEAVCPVRAKDPQE